MGAYYQTCIHCSQFVRYRQAGRKAERQAERQAGRHNKALPKSSREIITFQYKILHVSSVMYFQISPIFLFNNKRSCIQNSLIRYCHLTQTLLHYNFILLYNIPKEYPRQILCAFFRPFLTYPSLLVYQKSTSLKCNDSLLQAPPWSSITCWTTNHCYPCSNLDVVISKGCFIFDFALLHLECTRPIQPPICTKVVVKPQSSSSLIETNMWWLMILQIPLLRAIANSSTDPRQRSLNPL